MALDQKIRLAAFNWLSEQVGIHGDVLPRKLLERGFGFEGERIVLISPQGIFKPRVMQYPLTITTAPEGPYDDAFGTDGYLSYRYRGTNPDHRDNVGLREAYRNRIPLIYFHGVVPGKYLAVWPVYIIGDDPAALTFKVAVEDQVSMGRQDDYTVPEENVLKRAYMTAEVRIRLHQRGFREKVLAAYRSQCAFCKLKYGELLDAAHIISDNEPDSRPTIDNGLALCKLHHAAFDSFIISVNPDYIIHVRKDVLDEEDGPMLQHGLKELHKARI
ncbi:MAG TPA: HNH endonuclease, partial [Bacillota bacterium]|nr:HNH endonuclease [Bacillota bacterium]